jgi:hypothetical protein
MTTPLPQCVRCVHYLHSGRCAAFGVAIPVEIVAGKHDHRKPYPGDNGIQFEPLADDDGRTT